VVTSELRICQVHSHFIPTRGGIETFVYELSKHLMRLGHSVVVITSTSDPTNHEGSIEQIDGVEAVRYPIRRVLLEAPILVPIIFRVMWEKYDVLHVHGMIPGLTEFAALVGRLRRLPVVLTYHFDAETLTMNPAGKLANWAYPFFMRFFLPQLVDKVVATTAEYAETSPVLLYCKSKLSIIPCGIGKEFFQTSDGNLLEDRNDQSKRKRILYVGRLHAYKGVRDLISALRFVRKTVPEATLEILGDGPQRQELETTARRLGLSRAVSFRGSVPAAALLKAYERATMLVLPSLLSRREAFGIVILEAMAMGKPVIASDIPGPNSLIEHGKTGLLVPPSSPRRLAKAIIFLFQNESLARSMGNRGREKAIQFNWSVITEHYENLYSQSLVEKRGP
jgi:glycosyltransferase involved in cell wall biosynthesis